MMRQTTIFREAISLEKRVGIALWKLSTGNTYRSVGKAFGVSASLCCEVLLEFCTVLYMLAPRYIIEDFELLNSHGFELWNSHDFELLSVDYALFGQCIPQNLKAGVRTHTSF